MGEYKKYSFHFRHNYSSGGYKDYFLNAEAFGKDKAIELSKMGHKFKENLILIEDLSNYELDDYIDYVSLMDYQLKDVATSPLLKVEICRIKRNINIKKILENDN